MVKIKKPAGRPSGFTPKIGEAICDRIAMGEPLRQICRDEEMPSQSMVFRWLNTQPGFREQYARAREAMMDQFADEILEIADDATNDWIARENKDGSTYEALNTEAVQRSKLRIDTRQWLMGKCAPKKYGDKSHLEVTGKDGEAIKVADATAEEALGRLAPEQRKAIRSIAALLLPKE